MRSLILSVVTALLSVLLASTGFAQAPTATPVDLYGKVVGPDGKPVSGASVSLVEVDPQAQSYAINQTTTSDAQGKFKFTSARPTSLAVARVPGFAISGTVIQDSSVESPAEIKLKAPTELKLKFIGPDGNPLAGLKVWPTTMREQRAGVGGIGGIASYVILADKLKDEFTRTTDASGVCTFGEMPQGSTLQFEIGDDHFVTTGNATTINLAAAPITDGGTIQLELGGTISGKVTGPDSKPVAHLNVMAEGQAQTPSGSRSGWIVSAQTDADGKYVLKKARGGSYTLRFGMSAELSAQYVAPKPEPPFDLTAGQNLSGKDAVLTSGGIISGKVTKAGGSDPIAGVRIYAISLPDRQNPGVTSSTQSNAVTGADGKYIMHVTPGQQQVSMNNPPPVGYVMPQQRAPAKMITVEDGQTVTSDFELAVDTTPALKGHVFDEKGAPVAGASILLQASSNSNTPNARTYSPQISQTQTDNDGAFTIPGVAESTAIRVRKGTMATLAPMYVTAQNRQNVKITLHNGAVASVRIKLVDPAGAPIPDGQLAVVQIFGTQQMSMQAGITGPDGTDVLSSLYLDTIYSVQGRAKGYGAGTINLSLRPGATMDVPFSLIKADSFVAGMVLDENQLPLAGADVYATGVKSDRQTTKSDFTGHFRIDGLVPGDTISVYTAMNGRRGQAPAQTERAPAGTDGMILIHNPPAPATAPARGRIGR